MAMVLDQFKQVIRRLGRAPLFTAITLLTLAIGVGANTAIFSVVEGVLLKPLPYPHASELIGVWHSAPGIDIKELNMAPSIYFIDREQSTTLQDIGVYNGDSVSVTGAGEPEHVQGLDVTDGTLPLLGVVPALGRLFTRQDDTAGAPQTVLLSYGYWQKKFGGATSAIGQMLNVDGKPRQIIGVLPQGFHFLDREDDALFMPMQWDRSKTKLGNFSYRALARLKPGVTMEQASADMARLLPIAMRSFPAPEGFSAAIFEKVQIRPNLRPLKNDVVGDIGNMLWVLMGSIAVVLLVACANVANLLLVRVEGRRQELAVRSALGAGRGRIALELLYESALLGFAGSLIGLGLAYGALRVLVAIAPEGTSAHSTRLASIFPVLLFTLGLALVVSLLIGLVPVASLRRPGTERQPPRRRAFAEPGPRAAPYAQGAGGGAGRAGAGAADLLGADDPHLFGADACLSRLCRAGRGADISLCDSRGADTGHATRAGRPYGAGYSGQTRGHSRRLFGQLLERDPDGRK